MPRVPLAFVAMPWGMLHMPSIQLGTLQSVCAQEDIPVAPFSYFLQFMEYLAAATRDTATPLTVADYKAIASECAETGAGDFAFCVAPLREPCDERDEEYRGFLRERGRTEATIERLFQIRELVPAFLRQCAEELLALNPHVVAFTTTFGQNTSSLALASMLKRANPELVCVFGGANCESDMGEQLIRSFPFVDFVVRGEGELVLPSLVKQLIAGEPVSPQPGLCFRRDGDVVAVAETGASLVALDDIPIPDYREYFARLGALSIKPDIKPDIWLPFETARGCWWGAKSHCTFCGLNGEGMAYRSKSPDQAIDLMLELSRRHQTLSLFSADNIIDMSYFDSVLPQLASRGHHFRVFFETKANLTRAHVRGFYAAGIKQIQPGIESLSTPILKLMRKGVTALQNIRLLKWCAEYRIDVDWNIIYAFPGEDPEEYARMAQLVPALTHLQAPTLVPLGIDRFSPYFADPVRHGLEIAKPRWFYRYLYDVDDDSLARLAYHFDAYYAGQPDHEGYVAGIRSALESWKAHSKATYRSLSYRVGPSFVTIVDGRNRASSQRYTLDKLEAKIYLACDAGATPDAVLRRVDPAGRGGLNEQDVVGFLDGVCEEGLMYEEDGRYLSLAVGADPTRDAAALWADAPVGVDDARAVGSVAKDRPSDLERLVDELVHSATSNARKADQ